MKKHLIQIILMGFALVVIVSCGPAKQPAPASTASGSLPETNQATRTPDMPGATTAGEATALVPEPQATPSASAVPPQTIVLQQGLDGYAGAVDTWVSSEDWGTPPQYSANYGQRDILNLTRDGRSNPLLRFDLSGIPAGSQIISATLSLYNVTTGDCDVRSAKPRNTAMYAVLHDWDEGNQEGALIDSTGDHGATGDYAFQYYAEEGTSVTWNGRGMQAESDYRAEAEDAVGVLANGWYTWNATALVSAWVGGDLENYGMVLRDLTTYEEGNCDWRNFASGQSAEAAQHPKLTVIFIP